MLTGSTAYDRFDHCRLVQDSHHDGTVRVMNKLSNIQFAPGLVEAWSSHERERWVPAFKEMVRTCLRNGVDSPHAVQDALNLHVGDAMEMGHGSFCEMLREVGFTTFGGIVREVGEE